ncbi:hypothetical protein PAECIP111892_00252 [Paenibacillus auburnensis]|uniref:HEAT repeat domain-containing protein n=1 Tax=Paenibacillus auburnensis TaxID=2905649 RepID=A0ABN8FS87_9BACL|nr:hypothetical protein [Paenibacillus auburnensis]CAH1190575.1 hypothetical protein PAECIP111892_00252 [Paenibacillus auburnensis]
MSGKKAEEVHFQEWIENREHWPLLEGYMQDNSGLPGPRANLELAAGFARYFADSMISDTAWVLLCSWVDAPDEFLAFCAVQACGAHYAFADDQRRRLVERVLKAAMNAAGWRVREAAAIGLQSLGEADFRLLTQLLDGWREDATLLEQRAFVAALAHPPVLKNRDHVLYALDLAAGITDGILHGAAKGCDPEHFRVLSKGLEYSLSLFAAAEPEEGFALLRRLAESGDARMMKIVKSNLGKTRLSKKYPDRVHELLAGLTTV